MKSSASESIRNVRFNLKWLSQSSCLARPGILTWDRLMNSFDLDAGLFMYQTNCINYYNRFCSRATRLSYFFFIQIICWAPWISQVQSTGLPSNSLRAHPCRCYMYFILHVVLNLYRCNMKSLSSISIHRPIFGWLKQDLSWLVPCAHVGHILLLCL